jgi:5-methylcytosine-specific restriction endonuclease McrA
MKTCERCHNLAVNATKLCEICTLKRTSYELFGTELRWKDLAKLLESQNFTCPDTGIKLFLGKNASVDHIIPQSHEGGNNIENLRWVHIWVNKMKYTDSQEEFTREFDEFLLQTGKHRKLVFGN